VYKTQGTAYAERENVMIGPRCVRAWAAHPLSKRVQFSNRLKIRTVRRGTRRDCRSAGRARVVGVLEWLVGNSHSRAKRH